MELFVAEYPLRIVNIVELLMILLAVYGSFLLWNNDRFRGLCLVLTLQGLLMAFNFSEETGLFHQNYLITPIFSLCTGPVFYLFVRHLTYASHEWRWSQTINAIPALIALPFTGYTQTVLAIGTLSLIIYAVLSYRMLTRYHKAAQSFTSDDQVTRLSWLKRFMIVFAVLLVEDMVRINLQPYLDYIFSSTWYLLHQTVVLITFTTLVHLALRQEALFDELEDYDAFIETPEAELNKSLFEQINRMIDDEVMFRQPRLSLADVAEKSGLGIKDVSAAINHGSEMNFSEYINRKRIDYFISNSGSGASILDLALEAGFNSKSSFNTLFKSYMNTTPSQYLKSHS